MCNYSSPTLQKQDGILTLPQSSRSFTEMLATPAFAPALPLLQALYAAQQSRQYPLQSLHLQSGARLRGALREAMGLALIRTCHLVSLKNPKQVSGRVIKPILMDCSLILLDKNLGPIPADCQAWRFFDCWRQLSRCRPHSKLFNYGIQNMWTLLGYYLGYLEMGNRSSAQQMAAIVEPCLKCLPLALTSVEDRWCMTILFA